MKPFLLTVTILFFVDLTVLTAQSMSGSSRPNQSTRRIEIVSIFKRAISLNKKFLGSVHRVSADSLNKLRRVVEDFDKDYVDSARARANKILVRENDSTLLCLYLRYVICEENSAEEAITWDIGELFIQNPTIFLVNRCGFSKKDRSYLKKTIGEGLYFWRYQTKYDKQQIDSAEVKLKQF